MKRLLFLTLFLGGVLCTHAEEFTVSSPDKDIELTVKTTDKLYYKVQFKGEDVIWYSPISMSLMNGQVLGATPAVISHSTEEVKEDIATVWGNRKQVKDHYQELTLKMKGNYSLKFRVYDDGVAYRFVTDFKDNIRIMEEEISYRFTENHDLLAHVVGDFQTSYEKLYTSYKISEVIEKDFISLPLLVDQGKTKVVIAESDLYDYPGFYLMKRERVINYFLEGILPAFPTKEERGGHNDFNYRVEERANYLAETEGKRAFPWRVMIITDQDHELAHNDMVYKLARPTQIATDWIKPGLVSWDWWNDWNLKGVDFETGVNTRTYEYYIDFAAENGLDYVILDEGWSDQFDLLLMKENVDVPHLVEYGKKKGVDLILWAVWYTLDRQMQEALDLFEEWGVAGIKVDFIDRDDQIAVNFYERLVRESAKRKLLVDYHGCSKPTGLHRTYPNLINYEGVRGNEYNKFSTEETPDHNLDIVFTRMVTGPMDYTPGAMRNSTKGNWVMDNSNPMSYGTRAHQLGMYVVYYAPLQMLCDAPTAYTAEPEILDFLSKVPVTWDETVSLDGKVGEYILMARQKGEDWYVGAMTDWNGRTLEVDFSFLPAGTYEATMYLDGINAHRKAEDVMIKKMTVTSASTFSLALKPGGGAAMVLKKK
ncbi:MAG: glycoside hydrolase family 97 protein [Bacteroidota bacterium]